jgi:hypothetical protein
MVFIICEVYIAVFDANVHNFNIIFQHPPALMYHLMHVHFCLNLYLQLFFCLTAEVKKLHLHLLHVSTILGLS